MRGDLIETYKIMTGKDAVYREQFFQLSLCEYNLKGHSQYETVETTSQTLAILLQTACGEILAARCRGYYVSKSVQEPPGQVLAKVWTLKAWLNQPITGQVQIQVTTKVFTCTVLTCLKMFTVYT